MRFVSVRRSGRVQRHETARFRQGHGPVSRASCSRLPPTWRAESCRRATPSRRPSPGLPRPRQREHPQPAGAGRLTTIHPARMATSRSPRRRARWDSPRKRPSPAADASYECSSKARPSTCSRPLFRSSPGARAGVESRGRLGCRRFHDASRADGRRGLRVTSRSDER